LTQNAFVRQLLAHAIPDEMIVYERGYAMSGHIRKIPITKVYVIAHFALIEAGLLIPSHDEVERFGKDGKKIIYHRPIIECKEKSWRGKTPKATNRGLPKNIFTY